MPAIAIENLSKSYKGVKALDRVSLEVGQGELFAYLGPDGAGKTTTIRILTGMRNCWITWTWQTGSIHR